ncbi:MAG: hypothetical protein ACPL3P_01610 [Anaerolineales bacterium]
MTDTNPAPPSNIENSSEELTSQLRQDYEDLQNLFAIQPVIVQRFLENQASLLADAVVQNASQVRFSLPDRVICDFSPGHHGRATPIPADMREQMAGGLMDRLMRVELRVALRQRLTELEQSEVCAVSVAAKLLRHTTAYHMVHNMLPAGRSVTYRPAEGEEIPSIPVVKEGEVGSAITASTDAIVEETEKDTKRGELLVPYVPYARRFFLPQWVAFDEKGNLLLASVNEAEASIASMQRYLSVLHYAVALSPCVVVDKVYQQKRYGILGQLVNQGRALALYHTKEIIQTIKRRAAAQDLNRGLSLSLPYFDDQDLVMRTYDFVVIPAGRIMFVPAFVVRAAREEAVKIAQDTRLSHSTRKHLLIQLRLIESAFESLPEKAK